MRGALLVLVCVSAAHGFILEDALLLRASTQKDAVLRERLLTGVELALDYFERDAESINVDGLYGLRVAQGQLKFALQELQSGKSTMKLAADDIKRVQTVVKRAETIASKIYSFNYASDPEYLQRFAPLVDKPYMIPYSQRDLQGVPPQAGSEKKYSERFGDDCFAHIIGTKKTSFGKLVPKCTVTPQCWKYNTLPETTGYFVTHQLLYFVLAEHVECRPAMDKAAAAEGVTVPSVEQRYCRRILQEAEEEATTPNGGINPVRQDLFAEQVLLCGIMGFEDFAKRHWIEEVLTWQNPTGCFTMANRSPFISNMRRLLREVVADDGCLAHKSGLSTGVIGYFLRVLLLNGTLK